MNETTFACTDCGAEYTDANYDPDDPRPYTPLCMDCVWKRVTFEAVTED